MARIENAIVTNELTTVPLDRLSFEFDDSKPGIVVVDVRERHVGGRDGDGDPETAPRLFSFVARGTNGPLTTDASRSTEFEPIGE